MRDAIARLFTFVPLYCIAVGTPVAAANAQDGEAAQVRGVYRAALDELFAKSAERPGVIVINDSTLRFTRDRSWLSLQPVPIDYTAGPMKGMFPPDVTYSIPIELLTTSERRLLEARGQQALDSAVTAEKQPFWVGLSRVYVTAWGLTTFSEVLFDSERERALVEVLHTCGGGCFNKELMRVEKANGNWQVVDRLVAIDDYDPGEPEGNLRYTWTDAVVKPDPVHSASDSAWIADSVLFARTPSYISGRLAHKASGRPISGAQIVTTLIGGPGPKAVTDRNGRFRFDMHPTNVIYQIYCPLLPVQRRHLLEGGAFWPIAVDTGFVITLGDMSPCWRGRRGRPGDVGDLATSLYRDSPFPASDEAGVYRAVISDIRRTGESVLLRPMQAARCLHGDVKCGVPELSLLLAEGRIDSTAIASTRAGRLAAYPFNAGFARSNATTLLTKAAEEYLEYEADGAAEVASRFEAPVTPNVVRTAIQTYPRVRGITSLSPVAFDAKRQRALVQVRRERPDSLNALRTLLLVRRGQKWEVDLRDIESVSLSGRYFGNACVPGRRKEIPAASMLSALTGRYSFELVSETQAVAPKQSFHVSFRPRGIDTTGVRQLPFFQVFDPVTGRRDEFTESGLFIESGGRQFQRATSAMRIHGEGYALDVLEVRNGQIFGSWRYYYGPFVDESKPRRAEPAGHFCARTLSDPRNPSTRVVADLPG